MSRCVMVSFGAGREHEFVLDTTEILELSEEDARAWLSDQFDALGCEPSNPMGKVLVVDMILGVAKCAGDARFRNEREWGRQYARACARLRTETRLEVDVPGFVVR